MAELTAKFSAIDGISDIFDRIAERGEAAVTQWEKAGPAASEAFGVARTAATGVAQAADTASSSTDAWATSAENATVAADEAANAVSGVADSFDELESSSNMAGKTGVDAVQSIEKALIAAGLAKLIYDAANAANVLANEFSNASSVIAKSSGATGAELDSLNESMMNVYSNSYGSIDNVANVLSTLNTATGLTGKGLEDITDLTLEYARVNSEDAGASAATLGRLMNALDMDADGLAVTMNQLTKASQISGLGVNNLSEYIIQAGPSFEEMGFSVERSIALFSSFYQAGAEPRELLSSLNILLNRMAQDGATNAEEAFNQLLVSIEDAPDILAATSIASEAFGAKVGAKVADDIRAGRFEIDEWVNAISNSEGTIAASAAASVTLEEKWVKASNSMNTAFSSVLTPSVNNASSAFAELVGDVGDFLQKNEWAVYTLTGLGATILTATTAVTGYTLAVKGYTVAKVAATAAAKAFGVASIAALGPIALVGAAIGGVVAVALALNNAFNESNKEYNSLTSTSKQHYSAMRDLEDEYNRVAASVGDNTEKLAHLSAELETARAVYESSRMTIEEFAAQNDRLIDSHERLVESYTSSVEKINTEEKSAHALIGKLEQLSAKTSITAGEQQQMAAIVDKLNQHYPDLALNYDKATGAMSNSVDAIRAVAEARAVELRQAADFEAYSDLVAHRASLEEQLATAADEVAAASERYANANVNNRREMNNTRKDLKTFTEEHDRLQQALEETNNMLAENERAFEEAASAAEAAARAPVEYATAVNRAVQSVQDEINALSEAYDKSYEAAYRSLSSTLGLWNEMDNTAKTSADTLNSALLSQIEFMDNYASNLEGLTSRGIEGIDQLAAILSDGSKESAAALAGLAEASDDDISALIENMGRVEEGKQAFASSVAEMQTDFSAQMDKIVDDLEKAVGDMEMTEEAAAAARATMDAYISEILDSVAKAEAAGAAVSNALQNALAGNGVSLAGIPVPIDGFSTGTASAPRGVALVGEEGPELVMFSGGETVYTANETSEILAGASRAPLNVPGLPEPSVFAGGNNDGPAAIEHKHSIEINGSGKMSIDSKANKEQIIDVMIENIKPILLGIIQQEDFEEGELSYEF